MREEQIIKNSPKWAKVEVQNVQKGFCTLLVAGLYMYMPVCLLCGFIYTLLQKKCALTSSSSHSDPGSLTRPWVMWNGLRSNIQKIQFENSLWYSRVLLRCLSTCQIFQDIERSVLSFGTESFGSCSLDHLTKLKWPEVGVNDLQTGWFSCARYSKKSVNLIAAANYSCLLILVLACYYQFRFK